jgi:phosphoserine phosphatase
MRWSIDTKLISPDQASWLLARHEGYKNKTVNEYDICGDMTTVYRGLPLETLHRAASQFFAEFIEPNIFPELATLIADLQKTGCDIWAVSSTNNWVIEEGARRFNIPASHVLAAHVEIDSNGLVTDNLLHVPTDEDKVVALRSAGISSPDAVFGNSIHDAAMLSIARTHNAIPGAFPVNPSTDLLTRAAHEHWPVYYPASVTP